mmetsp:Transcript_14161/g.23457  ORF Transcript_14161/g.23457 Transcript_14161/m.23457 type:complete len:437 (-) Transcript_14161:133-1443(-)
MKVAAIVSLFVSSGHCFVPAGRTFQTRVASASTSSSSLQSTPDDAERIKEMKKILAEESMNPANFKESADRMKSMTPRDMDGLMKEMDEMSSEQQAQLKAMGMDPSLMKKSMEMMRDNPAMMQNVGKMMESMTPEQLVEQSLAAQEQMAKMPTGLMDQAVEAVNTVSKEEATTTATDVEVESVQDAEIDEDDEEEDDEDDDDEEYEAVPGSSVDPAVVDSMFSVAELMSMPPNGGVTKQGFSSLPPITLLSGNRDVDLSKKELSECWLDGSLGATRVDRAGFERVWKEVQEYFEDDIMEEARKMSTGKSKTASAAPAATSISNNPVVGSSISPEQLQDQVKNMKDSDMSAMLDQMNEMTPEQEARMKAMGVDPAMMQKTANMMKSNPLLRKAATTMMQNMSPDQMMKASQQAQEKMGGMSSEDYEKAMEMMNKEQK